MAAILEAQALKKTYKMGEHEVHALAGVDFGVEKGEFVAIMGPSGSGKSTLLHLLGGLDKPSDGEVTLVGKRLSILDDKQATLVRRRNIGFIFQFFNLLPTLSTEENVALPLIIDGKNPKAFAERITYLLDLVGLRDRRRHKPDQLSGVSSSAWPSPRTGHRAGHGPCRRAYRQPGLQDRHRDHGAAAPLM